MTDYKVSQLSQLTAPQQNTRVAVLDPNDTSTAPAGAGGSDKYVPWGQVGAAASADVARVFAAGHSYPSGYNSTEGGEAWPARLAGALKAELVLYALTGAALAVDSSGANSGGYANVLNALTPRVAGAGTYSVRNASPYLPLSPVTAFNYGFNDLAYVNSTVATAVAWFKMALRACACIARAGGYFPDTDGSVAYGGSGGSHWSAQTGQQAYGSPTNHKTTTAADTVTITVPSDFPGGEVDILTIAYGGGTKWSTTVDGGAAQVNDGTGSAYGSASSRGNLVVQRLTGLSSGTHTIVMTMVSKDSSATAIFDSWLIAAPQLPQVCLVNQPAAPALPYSPSGSPVHTPVTSTDVGTLNAAISALCGEFTDGNVILADVATAFASAGGNVAHASPNSLYSSDNLHPNANGHALAAQVVQAAVRSAPLPTAARESPMGLVMRQVGGPLEPAFSSGWSSLGWAWFGMDKAGNAWLQLKVVNSSSPSAGDTVLVLPAGYPPSVQVLVSATAWASGYTGTVAAALGVQDDGTVQWFGGDPSTELDVTWSWPANGPGF